MAAEVLILGAGGHGRVVLEPCVRGEQAGFLDPAALRKTVDGAAVRAGTSRLAQAGQDRSRQRCRLNGDVASRRRVYERASPRASVPAGRRGLRDGVGSPASGAQVAVVRRRADRSQRRGQHRRDHRHDAVVGAHAFGPGAVVLGNCRVGAGAFVGSAAVVLPGVSVGAGAVVARARSSSDVPAGARVASVPARRLARWSDSSGAPRLILDPKSTLREASKAVTGATASPSSATGPQAAGILVDADAPRCCAAPLPAAWSPR
jgi:acetyltransferase-like isoleucine patch superfamily enzyme